MAAGPLAVGNADERDERHCLLDPVDIAGNRMIEEIAPADAGNGKAHRREYRGFAGKRKDRFDAVEMTIEPAEDRFVLEDRRWAQERKLQNRDRGVLVVMVAGAEPGHHDVIAGLTPAPCEEPELPRGFAHSVDKAVGSLQYFAGFVDFPGPRALGCRFGQMRPDDFALQVQIEAVEPGATVVSDAGGRYPRLTGAASADRGASGPRINASIRSAIFRAGSRSWATVQLAAQPSVTSLARAWLTRRFVGEGGGVSSRSATVMKQFRGLWTAAGGAGGRGAGEPAVPIAGRRRPGSRLSR